MEPLTEDGADDPVQPADTTHSTAGPANADLASHLLHEQPDEAETSMAGYDSQQTELFDKELDWLPKSP